MAVINGEHFCNLFVLKIFILFIVRIIKLQIFIEQMSLKCLH